MPKTALKRPGKRGPASPRTIRRIRAIRFASIGETDFGTDQQHFDLLAGELPHLRMAVILLNYSDRELEAKARSMDADGLRALLAMADELRSIGDRHRAITELCDGVYARVVVLAHRFVYGPKTAEVAHA